MKLNMLNLKQKGRLVNLTETVNKSFLCKLGLHKSKIVKVEDEGTPVNFEDWETFYFAYHKCVKCGIEWKESILRSEYIDLQKRL